MAGGARPRSGFRSSHDAFPKAGFATWWRSHHWCGDKHVNNFEPGKWGNFIVLDAEVFSIDPSDFHASWVLAVYFEGQKVYGAREPESKPG